MVQVVAAAAQDAEEAAKALNLTVMVALVVREGGGVVVLLVLGDEEGLPLGVHRNLSRSTKISCRRKSLLAREATE